MKLIRTLAATALQVGISAGVLLMILVQMRVAIRDDATREARPRGGRG